MQIKEARVFNFGKLQKKDYQFSPGINVIYGPNEAGKTTLHTFLLAMLFGMDKNRGRSAAGDVYTRYEPWHAPSFYSGAIRFSVEGRPFYLERNFYHREKRELLRNEADGEELSVAYGDLAMLLGGIGKETFGNTYDVPQCGVLDGKELADILTEYLADAAESGDGGTHVAKAVAALDSRRKELNVDLRKLQEQKQKEKRELEIEQELLEKDCGTLRIEITREEAELEHAKLIEQTRNLQKPDPPQEQEHADSQDDQMMGHTNRQRNRICRTGNLSHARFFKNDRILVTVFFLALLANLGVFFGYGYESRLFALTESALGILFAATLLIGKISQRQKEQQNNPVIPNGTGKNAGEEKLGHGIAEGIADTERIADIAKTAKTEKTAETELKLDSDASWSQARRILDSQRELLLEKETRLYNISEALSDLSQPGQKETELLEDMQALELAATEIRRLAKEYGEEAADELNAELSRWTSLITGGVYDSVRVDADGALKVAADGQEIAPEALSRGTLEQFYLAFRIAVGNIVTREEPMPLFLDETFCMYDEKRLAQTLAALVQMRQQIFLFTCQRREIELLEQMGITYHVVNME